MWLVNKYVALNRSLLGRIQVVEVDRHAEVRNEDGNIQALVKEPGQDTSWWFGLQHLGTQSQAERIILDDLMEHVRFYMDRAFPTKHAKVFYLAQALGINFNNELRRRR